MATTEMNCLSGGGGSLSETPLWSNSATSSDFASGTQTLSESIDNYDYISIEYKYQKTDADSTSKKVLMSVDDFKAIGNNNYAPRLSLGSKGDTAYFIRYAYYLSGTSVGFTDNMRANANQTSNNYNIPIAVYGIK